MYTIISCMVYYITKDGNRKVCNIFYYIVIKIQSSIIIDLFNNIID